ncbi:Uncharacterized protein HZ326_12015 [Fusarium oxysporum f. sp. albedinis]|nr:Uncharacterized protein HZ326_12015 [Fusarium oxysporum f. sp. albedinis]
MANNNNGTSSADCSVLTAGTLDLSLLAPVSLHPILSCPPVSSDTSHTLSLSLVPLLNKPAAQIATTANRLGPASRGFWVLKLCTA